MNKAGKMIGSINDKINRIWEETGQVEKKEKKQGTGKERFKAFVHQYRWEIFVLIVMGIMMFGLSYILPTAEGPDEPARYLVPQYIYKHGTLPVAWDPEILDKNWGISYAFHPILPYILGGYLMKVVGLFSTGEHALLMAARSANIMVGLVFYLYVMKIAKELFQRKLFRVYFTLILLLWPQTLFLFLYVNTDGIAICSGAIIVYYWIRGIKTKWNKHACTGLAAGLAVCALSYFNAYGYGLMSVFLFCNTILILFRKEYGWKKSFLILVKRGIYVSVLVFLLAGWWFIRAGIQFDGDILGLRASEECQEKNAVHNLKPSVKLSPYEEGIDFDTLMRLPEEGGYGWKRSTYRSSIAVFGMMKHYISQDVYEIPARWIKMGIVGWLLFAFLSVAAGPAEWIRKKWADTGKNLSCIKWIRRPEFRLGEEKVSLSVFLILQFSFVCCIIIPIVLSIYYSWFSDFQAQGRYVLPLLVPLVYLIASGTENVMTICFPKWIMYILMIPLFYSIMHVFLSAYVSTYLPTYVESLSGLLYKPFPWFSNIGLLWRTINLGFQMFFPG